MHNMSFFLSFSFHRTVCVRAPALVCLSVFLFSTLVRVPITFQSHKIGSCSAALKPKIHFPMIINNKWISVLGISNSRYWNGHSHIGRTGPGNNVCWIHKFLINLPNFFVLRSFVWVCVHLCCVCLFVVIDSHYARNTASIEWEWWYVIAGGVWPKVVVVNGIECANQRHPMTAN